MSEENQITIEDDVVEVVEEEFSIEGLSEDELRMANDLGLVKEKKEDGEEDGKHKEQPETKSKDSEAEEEINKDPDNFEEMDAVIEKDEKKFHKTYSPNQKALYFKNKANKQKKQELEKRYNELEAKFNDVSKLSDSGTKLEKINKLLTEDVDNLTIEALQAIMNAKGEVKEPEPIKPDVMAEKFATKASYAEKIGNAKYGNFVGIAGLAKEVSDNDKSGTYQKVIDEAFINDDIDEDGLVNRIVNIAKLHPKYNEVINSVNTESNDTMDRAIKNSKKKASSASLSSSGGKRTVSESELTCDQIARLPLSEYAKLSEKTRKRAMMGIDP